MITNIGISSASPVVRLVDGEAMAFQRLSKRRLVAKLAEWAAKDRESLVKRLDESDIKGKERFCELSTFDDRAREPHYGFICCGQLARALEIVAMSLGKDVPDDFPFDSDAVCGLAMELWSQKTYYDMMRRLNESQSGDTADDELAGVEGNQDDPLEMPTRTVPAVIG